MFGKQLRTVILANVSFLLFIISAGSKIVDFEVEREVLTRKYGHVSAKPPSKTQKWVPLTHKRVRNANRVDWRKNEHTMHISNAFQHCSVLFFVHFIVDLNSI